MADNTAEKRRFSQEDIMTLKGNVRSIIITVVCFAFFSLFIVGCSTTKNLLGYLKIWGPASETDQTFLSQKGAISLPPIRPVLRGNPDSHFLLGQYMQQRGRHREAIEEFTKTIKIDPKYAKAYNAIGISHDNLGEFERATRCYEVALDLSPTGEYFNNLGYNLILKGNYDEAVEVLKTAVALDPRNEQIRNNLALAHSNKGNHDFALGEIQKTDDPDGNRIALAEALLKTGKALVASELVAQASRLDSIFEQKLSGEDQFVIRMIRALKEQDNMKIAAKDPEKTWLSDSAFQRNDKDKEAGKASVGVRIAKVRTARPTKDSTAVYPSDFMLNRTPKEVTMIIEDRKPKNNQESAIPLIRQLFPVQYAAGRSFVDRTPHTSWF